MTREELIGKIAKAIAEKEGFFVSEAQARARGANWPTRAQRNANPGNIRAWKDATGSPYPTNGGYVDFVAFAREKHPNADGEELRRLALEEGWRVLGVLVGRYLSGKYHGGRSPSLLEMFSVYSPASDNNDPIRYARFVAEKVGVPADKPLCEVVQ